MQIFFSMRIFCVENIQFWLDIEYLNVTRFTLLSDSGHVNFNFSHVYVCFSFWSKNYFYSDWNDLTWLFSFFRYDFQVDIFGSGIIKFMIADLL
jgi:hypothetical protein